MKNRKMLDIMGLADEKYISEAEPKPRKLSTSNSKPRPKIKWATILTAAACFLLILNIAITIPILANLDEPTIPGADSGTGSLTNPGDNGLIHLPVSSQKPSDNQGSDVPPPTGSSNTDAPGTDQSTGSDGNHIQNPNEEQPKQDEEIVSPQIQFLKNPALLGALDKYFDNNENLLDQLFPEIEDAMDKNEQGSAEMGDLSDNLQESVGTDINDNQVAGISEGDIAKRSDKFIYYLKGSSLYVYSINGKGSEVNCILPLDGYLSQFNDVHDSMTGEHEELEKIEEIEPFSRGWEMYLSSDFSTLTIITTSDRFMQLTGIFTIDVSASPTAVIKDFKIFSGKYITSRMVEDQLLLFTGYSVSKGYDKENPLAYIPFYRQNNQEYFTNDIYFPSDLYTSTYVTVSRLDRRGLRVAESVSFLSFDTEAYVSQENIFLTHKKNPLSSDDMLVSTSQPYDTEIVAIGYKSELFDIKEPVTVKGYVKDQYSLDEYKGILRVATTSYFPDNVYTTTASLFCIDIESMKIVASVEHFAPRGEIIRSVRFDGDKGYICTSYKEVLIDPVFFFDLSDLESITYTETGEIDGYSSSLINIGGGYVIGIGYGDNTSTLKIEAYKEGQDSVEIVCFEEFAKTRFATSYKAYYVDRSRHLIGLPISTYSSDTKSYQSKYLLLHFNGTYFDFIISDKLAQSVLNATRGFYEDGYYYTVTDKDLTVFDVGNLDSLPFITAGGAYENEAENTLPTQDPSTPAWPPVS